MIMKNYLPQKTADYMDEQLNITPQRVLDASVVDKTQKTRRTDDGGLNVVEISADVKFEVPVQWDTLSEVDEEYILDLYLNSSKANRHMNTIEWIHPTDGNTYIVRFLDNVNQQIKPGNIRTVPQTTLLVEGYK